MYFEKWNFYSFFTACSYLLYIILGVLQSIACSVAREKVLENMFPCPQLCQTNLPLQAVKDSTLACIFV